MFKAPTQLPPVSFLLDDLPTRDARRVARHLGLSEATIKRYRRDDDATRLVLLALFWETRWGRSIMDTELEHRHRMHLGLIGALRRRIAELEATVGRLLELGDFGAANDPLFASGLPLQGLQHLGEDLNNAFTLAAPLFLKLGDQRRRQFDGGGVAINHGDGSHSGTLNATHAARMPRSDVAT